MSKNYSWHLVCETHNIDEWASCQTTCADYADDDIAAQKFISEYAEDVRDGHNCSKAIENLATLVEESIAEDQPTQQGGMGDV